MKRSPITPTKIYLDMQVTAGRRWRCKPLKTWIKSVRENLLYLKITDGLCENVLHEEPYIIHVADPNNTGNEL